MSIWVSPYSSRFLPLLGDDVRSFKLSENEEWADSGLLVSGLIGAFLLSDESLKRESEEDDYPDWLFFEFIWFVYIITLASYRSEFSLPRYWGVGVVPLEEVHILFWLLFFWFSTGQGCRYLDINGLCFSDLGQLMLLWRGCIVGIFENLECIPELSFHYGFYCEFIVWLWFSSVKDGGVGVGLGEFGVIA